MNYLEDYVKKLVKKRFIILNIKVFVLQIKRIIIVANYMQFFLNIAFV